MWSNPEPGDIVWCRFPQIPQSPRDQPGPKSRPTLIVGVGEKTDGLYVHAAYGTSQKPDRLYPGEFLIAKIESAAAYRAAGLSYDTKFALTAVLALPWNSDFFSVAPGTPFGHSPKLGALQGASVQKFYAAATLVDLRARLALLDC